MCGEKGIKEEIDSWWVEFKPPNSIHANSSNLQQLFGNFDRGVNAWRFIKFNRIPQHLSSVQIGPSNHELKMTWSHIESVPKQQINNIIVIIIRRSTYIQTHPITSFNKSFKANQGTRISHSAYTFPTSFFRHLPPQKVSTAIYLPRRLGRLKSSARRLCWSPPMRLGPVITAKGCQILTAYHLWKFFNRLSRKLRQNDARWRISVHTNLATFEANHLNTHGLAYERPC